MPESADGQIAFQLYIASRLTSVCLPYHAGTLCLLSLLAICLPIVAPVNEYLDSGFCKSKLCDTASFQASPIF